MITVNTKLSKYCLPEIGTFASSVPNTLAAILLQEAREGKSVLASLPAAWGKPSPFIHKPSWLHLTAQSLIESPYQPMPLAGT